MSKETIYETELYRVVVNRDVEYDNYEVINKEHDVIEARESNKPQALIIAKQFTILLQNDTWSRTLDGMYGLNMPMDSSNIVSIN